MMTRSFQAAYASPLRPAEVIESRRAWMVGNSAAGSEYEQFAGTCGDRFEYSDTEPCDGRV